MLPTLIISVILAEPQPPQQYLPPSAQYGPPGHTGGAPAPQYGAPKSGNGIGGSTGAGDDSVFIHFIIIQ